MIGGNSVSDSFNQDSAAIAAEGALEFCAGHVAEVNIVQPGLSANIVGAPQGAERGGHRVGIFGLRMKSTDVPGDIRTGL